MQKDEKFTPLEKRELRGLTMENVLKYITGLIALIIGYMVMQSRIEKLEKIAILNNTSGQNLNSQKLEASYAGRAKKENKNISGSHVSRNMSSKVYVRDRPEQTLEAQTMPTHPKTKMIA